MTIDQPTQERIAEALDRLTFLHDFSKRSDVDLGGIIITDDMAEACAVISSLLTALSEKTVEVERLTVELADTNRKWLENVAEMAADQYDVDTAALSRATSAEAELEKFQGLYEAARSEIIGLQHDASRDLSQASSALGRGEP